MQRIDFTMSVPLTEKAIRQLVFSFGKGFKVTNGVYQLFLKKEYSNSELMELLYLFNHELPGVETAVAVIAE